MKKNTFGFIIPLSILLLLPVRANCQWTRIKSPSGGDVLCFAVRDTLLFAGMEYHGGVALSSNNGETWKTVSAGLRARFVFALAVKDNKIFAGTDSGIFVSSNDGTNWSIGGLRNSVIRSFAFLGSSCFAGTDNGIFLSTNGGETWTLANEGLTYRGVSNLVVMGRELFAGSEALGVGVFLSRDNGETWTQASGGLSSDVRVYSLATIDTKLLAGTYDGVHASTNRGLVWHPAKRGLTVRLVKCLLVYENYVLAGGYGKVSVSSDLGATWAPVSDGLTGSIVYALAIKGGDAYASTYGWGMFRRRLSEMIGRVGAH